MSEEDLDKLEELCEKATPPLETNGLKDAPADAVDFYAAARTAVPELIKMVKTLEYDKIAMNELGHEKIEKLEAEVKRLQGENLSLSIQKGTRAQAYMVASDKVEALQSKLTESEAEVKRLEKRNACLEIGQSGFDAMMKDWKENLAKLTTSEAKLVSQEEKLAAQEKQLSVARDALIDCEELAQEMYPRLCNEEGGSQRIAIITKVREALKSIEEKHDAK